MGVQVDHAGQDHPRTEIDGRGSASAGAASARTGKARRPSASTISRPSRSWRVPPSSSGVSRRARSANGGPSGSSRPVTPGEASTRDAADRGPRSARPEVTRKRELAARSGQRARLRCPILPRDRRPARTVQPKAPGARERAHPRCVSPARSGQRAVAPPGRAPSAFCRDPPREVAAARSARRPARAAHPRVARCARSLTHLGVRSFTCSRAPSAAPSWPGAGSAQIWRRIRARCPMRAATDVSS